MSIKSILFSFQGRIGRQTYWFCVLGFFVAFMVAGLLVDPLGEAFGGIVALLVMIAVTYMSFAVAAKRWHDRNKSGWWSLIAFIPIIGQVWMLVENGFLPGTRGPNRFGPDPIGPVQVEYQGQTYYRHSDGNFTDATGSPVRDVALVAGLAAAYVAVQSTASDAFSNSAFDRVDDSSTSNTDATTQATPAADSGSSGWSWGWGGSSDSGSSSDSGGSDGGGGSGGGD